MTGQEYDSGLAVEVVFCENPDDISDNTPPIILEMLAPVVLKNGEVVSSGQVVISKPFNIQKPKKKEKNRQQEKQLPKKPV